MFVCTECYAIATYNLIKNSRLNRDSELRCIKCRQDRMVEIDDGIAEQISIFWRNGIQTQFCCSGHPFEQNRPYIIFKNDDRSELEKFREMLISIRDKHIVVKEIEDCIQGGKYPFIQSIMGNETGNNYRFILEYNDDLYLSHKKNRFAKNEFIKKFSNFLYKVINHMKLRYK